ncbi:MAG: PhoU domain-containing protein [Archaeoglobaceae archaeon]
MEIKIYDHCARILIRFNPLAKDFRFTLSVMRMFDLILEGYENPKELLKLSKLDDAVDDIYIEVMNEIENDFKSVDEVLAVRHIERIGDLLCKIATRLLYAIEGK